MSNRIVFFDENKNELDFYVNEGGNLYVQVGQRDEEGGVYNGFIELDIEDVEKMIDALMEKKEEMGRWLEEKFGDRDSSAAADEERSLAVEA